MMDLESMIRAQRIMCLKKYLDDYTSAWKSFLSYYLYSYKDIMNQVVWNNRYILSEGKSCIILFFITYVG